jgi:hypothetical protein
LAAAPAGSTPADPLTFLHQEPTVKGTTMTREEAFARCAPDSYVEFYGGRWLVVPFAQVEQPLFFVCAPQALRTSN